MQQIFENIYTVTLKDRAGGPAVEGGGYGVSFFSV